MWKIAIKKCEVIWYAFKSVFFCIQCCCLKLFCLLLLEIQKRTAHFIPLSKVLCSDCRITVENIFGIYVCNILSFWYTSSKGLCFDFICCIGRSALVGQRPTKSLWSVCPSARPSVTKFSQDWIISFFWYCPWWWLTIISSDWRS